MIKLENITKVYGSGDTSVLALNNINLTIGRGEFISIIGPSGCGKSTLLNLIGCVDKSSSGKIFINNNDITNKSYNELAALRNNTVGFVFQNFALLNNFNVLENIILPLRVRKMSENDRVFKATEILKKLGLEDKKHKKITEISGGQQQRVAIGRTLIQESDIILADEPTGALDEETGLQILNLLKDLNRNLGKTIIIVTHNKDIANNTDRIVEMKNGSII